MCVGVGEIAAVEVLVGVVFGCAAGVEDDDEAVEEDEAVEVEVDVEVVEEDDALLVTLMYCEVNRSWFGSKLLYIPRKKMSLRNRSCDGRPFQT